MRKSYVKKKDALEAIPSKRWLLKGTIVANERVVPPEEVHYAVCARKWKAYYINRRMVVHPVGTTDKFYEETDDGD